MRATILVLALTASPGCALIDGLAGDGPDPPSCPDPTIEPFLCPQFTCQAPFQLGFPDLFNVGVNVCGQTSQFDSPVCGPPGADDAVMELPVPRSGEYLVCFNSGPTGALSIANACNPDFTETGCIRPGECGPIFLGGPSAFIFWRSEFPGTCGEIRLDVLSMDGPLPEGNCLDGADDDGDSFTDCEDPDCRTSPECQGGFQVEVCDGLDNGVEPGFDPGLVDELACPCVTDEGCDSIDPMPLPFRCHKASGGPGNPDEIGRCAPDCRGSMMPWCEALGGTCSMTGHCIGVPF